MMSSLNIYQMYNQNGDKAGFCVRRNSWSRWYARVVSVSGNAQGELSGQPPYYNNPKVIGDLYCLNTNRLLEHGKELTCAGTFGYALYVPNTDD